MTTRWRGRTRTPGRRCKAVLRELPASPSPYLRPATRDRCLVRRRYVVGRLKAADRWIQSCQIGSRAQGTSKETAQSDHQHTPAIPSRAWRRASKGSSGWQRRSRRWTVHPVRPTRPAMPRQPRRAGSSSVGLEGCAPPFECVAWLPGGGVIWAAVAAMGRRVPLPWGEGRGERGEGPTAFPAPLPGRREWGVGRHRSGFGLGVTEGARRSFTTQPGVPPRVQRLPA